MSESFRFADDLGPEKLVELYEPAVGLKAIVAIDNTACGPAIGGVRMAPDVSAAEAFRLARAMTLKNAAAGLPHGGGKSVIFADPKMPRGDKARLVRAFAQAIRELVDYVPGPDMGTDERSMAWIHDEIGRAVGLPAELGGIPLDEIGATGFGLAVCIDAAADFSGLRLEGARVAVQGFGSVGQHAARFLAERGCRLVAAADSSATALRPDGLDVAALIAHKRAGRALAAFPGAETRGPEAVIDAACEIWIPAARPDVLHAGNVGRLTARLVAQGANIPCTPEAEAELHRRGVLVLPDFIANAGGVICAAVEHRGGAEAQAFETIRAKLTLNTRQVLDEARHSAEPPRTAATALALRRVRSAMEHRRWN